MLIAYIAVLAAGLGAIVVGLGTAVLELFAGNYAGSMIGSMVAVVAVPIVLIGHNMINLSTPLAVHAGP